MYVSIHACCIPRLRTDRWLFNHTHFICIQLFEYTCTSFYSLTSNFKKKGSVSYLRLVCSVMKYFCVNEIIKMSPACCCCHLIQFDIYRYQINFMNTLLMALIQLLKLDNALDLMIWDPYYLIIVPGPSWLNLTVSHMQCVPIGWLNASLPHSYLPFSIDSEKLEKTSPPSAEFFNKFFFI